MRERERLCMCVRVCEGGRLMLMYVDVQEKKKRVINFSVTGGAVPDNWRLNWCHHHDPSPWSCEHVSWRCVCVCVYNIPYI